MNKPKKGAVTVESYCPLYDPNYGKQFAICGHGVVHLEGEACDCARRPGYRALCATCAASGD